jgi:hypothetical protein
VTTIDAGVGSSFAGFFSSVEAVPLGFNPRFLFKSEGATKASRISAVPNVAFVKHWSENCDGEAEYLR